MKAPVTSIQFLLPGNREAKIVYWGMSRKTTDVLMMMLTMVPEVYCKERMKAYQVVMADIQWAEVAPMSLWPLGHTGSSRIKVRIVLQISPTAKAQNNDLNLCS